MAKSTSSLNKEYDKRVDELTTEANSSERKNREKSQMKIFRKGLAILVTLGVFSVGIIGGHTIFMASINAVLTWLVANYLLQNRYFGD